MGKKKGDEEGATSADDPWIYLIGTYPGGICPTLSSKEVHSAHKTALKTLILAVVIPKLGNPCSFTTQITQVVELGATNTTTGNDFNIRQSW